MFCFGERGEQTVTRLLYVYLELHGNVFISVVLCLLESGVSFTSTVLQEYPISNIDVNAYISWAVKTLGMMCAGKISRGAARNHGNGGSAAFVSIIT